MKILDISGPTPHTKPLVVIAVLTRNRPERLAKCLDGIRRGMRTSLCDSLLWVWNNGDAPVAGQTHHLGHNVGQHIAINRMIQEAVTNRADWFVRVDDDCEFQTRDWLARMIHIQKRHMEIYKRPCVLAPFVHGLRNPPAQMADVRIGKYLLHVVPMLGGICRMMPMNHLRYWRFDERMPMGWSEASAYARYCIQTMMPMLRCVNIEVSHGGSTDEQDAAEPDLAYEREMLKHVAYGL